MIDMKNMLAATDMCRHVRTALHKPVNTKVGLSTELILNTPLRYIFSPHFLRSVLTRPAFPYVTDVTYRDGQCAYFALSMAGVKTMLEMVGREYTPMRGELPEILAVKGLSVQRLVTLDGMTPEAAALTLDVLQSLGHSLVDEPDFQPKDEAIDVSPVLSMLGIAA